MRVRIARALRHLACRIGGPAEVSIPPPTCDVHALANAISGQLGGTACH